MYIQAMATGKKAEESGLLYSYISLWVWGLWRGWLGIFWWWGWLGIFYADGGVRSVALLLNLYGLLLMALFANSTHKVDQKRFWPYDTSVIKISAPSLERGMHGLEKQ